jgi:hypothetical protein
MANQSFSDPVLKTPRVVKPPGAPLKTDKIRRHL